MSNVTKFKVGDKVRLITDGYTGKLNEITYKESMFIDHVVKFVFDNKVRVDRLFVDIPTSVLEPIPEPKPIFAGIKVGDWVEIRTGGHFQVKRVEDTYFMLADWGCDTNARYDYNGINLYDEFRGNHDIVEILSPKEVVIDFGSGINGCVKWHSKFNNSISVFTGNDSYVATIMLSTLDHETRVKVESLLKAQEEAND